MNMFINFLVTTVLPSSEDNFNYTPTGPIAPDQPVGEILTSASSWLFATLGIVAVIFLIIGGIQYATAMGDSTKIDQAKRTLRWTMFGILLSIMAYVLVPTVANLFQ